jgi:Choline/Carnitine o-acyltransferase
MILQLSWYRTRGQFTATYETALTRMFQHGRTETIRTLSSDSRAFVLAMTDPSQPVSTSLPFEKANDNNLIMSNPPSSNVQIQDTAKYRALQRAVQTHVSLTREAATGRGIDRHLLGLRLVLRADEGERAELFDDELFQRSQEWKLSTSGLSAGHYFRGTG